MPLQDIRVVVAALYVACVVAAGFASGVTSAAGWATVGGFALLPAGAWLTLWQHPLQTLSESIQAARRNAPVVVQPEAAIGGLARQAL